MNGKTFISVGIIVVALMATASACQESCIVHVTRSLSGTVERFQGEKGDGVTLVVREAPEGPGSKSRLCGRAKGKVVMRVKTGPAGEFNLGTIKPGYYWLTYMDPSKGESFFVQVSSEAEYPDLRLTLGGVKGCYTEDIERNETNPPGWPKPLQEKKSRNR